MKIVCDSCGAKYQVADEKVKNKVFKIRCKRCENVIIVRGGEVTSSAAADVAQAQHQASDESLEKTRQAAFAAGDESVNEGVHWHIVVDGQQVGPKTAEDIAGYLGRGEVTADAFVWREGMGDWAKLSTVDDFAHLFEEETGAAGAHEADYGAEQPFEAPAHDFGGVEQADGVDHDDDVMASNHVPADDDGLFAGVDAEASSARVSSGSQLTNQRNENSVLFSLDALSEGAAAQEQVTNTGGTDASGLIDISMLGADSGSGADLGDAQLFGSSGPMGPAPVAMPRAMPSLVMKRRTNTGLIVGLVIGGIALAAGVGFAVYYAIAPKTPASAAANVAASAPPVAKPPAPKVTTATPAPSTEQQAKTATALQPSGAGKVAVAGTQPDASGGNPAAAAKTGQADEKTVDAEVQKPTRVAVASPKPPKKAAKTKRRPRSRRASKPRVAKPTPKRAAPRAKPKPKPAVAAAPPPRPRPKPAKTDEVDDLLGALDGKPAAAPAARRSSAPSPTSAGSDDALLPDQLSRKDVFSVIQRNAGKIRKCREVQPDMAGRVKVKFVVGRSGRVQSTKIMSPKYQGTPIGGCVERKIRAFRFNRFKGAPMPITVPFGI